MDAVHLGTRSRVDLFVGAAIILVCPIVAALAVTGGKLATLAVAGVAALAAGVYVGLYHPLWYFWGLAASLGAVPFGYVPGVHLPLISMFAALSLLAAIVHRSERRRLHTLEGALLVFVAVSGVSMLATGRTVLDIVEYTKWAILTLVVIALLGLPGESLAKFGRIFVYAAALNGLFGLAIVGVGHSLINVLSPFGYGRVETARYVYSDQGVVESVRLGGTWVDPNSAGICLLIALAMSFVLLEGWRRTCVSGVIAVSLILTLSRSAILSLAVAVMLVLLFHIMQPKHRARVTGVVAIGAIAAIATPAVRNRLLMSFEGGGDYATRKRWEAIAEFPHLMSGHWLFGLGWARPEFKNGSLAFTMNHVSNAPLLQIYRGGLIVGLLFLAVLAIGCVMGWRAIRSDSLPLAMYGAIFICFAIITVNLDHPVVAVPPITTTFSVFLVFMVYVDRQRRERAWQRHAISPAAETVLSSTH